MKLAVVEACFIGIVARSHGKIQAGEGLMSEMLVECDEYGVKGKMLSFPVCIGCRWEKKCAIP